MTYDLMQNPIDIYETPKSPFGSRKRRNRNANSRLYIDQNGICAYCNIKTTFPKRFSSIPRITDATVEHKYFRWDIRRAICEDVVMVCWKCNSKKNEADHISLWGGWTYLGNEINILEFIK
jgi:5-methylcytosine-specific restriction endonuclease McrA